MEQRAPIGSALQLGHRNSVQPPTACDRCGPPPKQRAPIGSALRLEHRNSVQPPKTCDHTERAFNGL